MKYNVDKYIQKLLKGQITVTSTKRIYNYQQWDEQEGCMVQLDEPILVKEEVTTTTQVPSPGIILHLLREEQEVDVTKGNNSIIINVQD